MIDRMNAAANHRGPDYVGRVTSENVALGHTRLSIIDLTEGGRQPMSLNGSDIVFNGEIYNYVELGEELRAKGWQFHTSSDTEVLLAALGQWGIGALERLNGMFAFIYFDRRKKQLYLARDRFGQKPLVYALTDQGLFAASEAKQILSSRAVEPDVNHDSVLRFLRWGKLSDSTATFFQRILDLPAGHFARLDLTTFQFEIKCWYDIAAKHERSADNYDVAREKVRHLLVDSVRLQNRSDATLGACLSGGIDSSSIVALSAALERPGPMTTITSYSDQKGFDERRFSRSIVAKFGLPSIEVKVDPGVIWCPKVLEEMAYFQDQPIPSGSHMNEYYVFKAAHGAGIRVMLDGQGADEYFGGYGEFWHRAQMEHLRRGELRRFWTGVRNRADATGRKSSQILSNLLGGNKVYAQLRPRKQQQGAETWFRAVDVETHDRPKSFADLSVRQLKNSSIPYQLHSQDRSSMRWSVETRLPFLDHRLVEYVLSLPTSFKVSGGNQKRILRDAVHELPADIAGRRDKIGFAAPDLAGLVARRTENRDMIAAAAEALGDYVDRDKVIATFDRVTSSPSPPEPALFRLASMGAWVRAFVEQNPVHRPAMRRAVD